MVIETHGDKETLELGARIAKGLFPGICVYIEGDLGSGKTVLVKGIAKGLGIKENITSPTFNIVNQYSGEYTFNHFDLYRIAYADELEEIGIYEYLEDGICVFEWPKKVKDIIHKECIEIIIQKNLDKGENYRKITLDSKGIIDESIIM